MSDAKKIDNDISDLAILSEEAFSLEEKIRSIHVMSTNYRLACKRHDLIASYMNEDLVSAKISIVGRKNGSSRSSEPTFTLPKTIREDILRSVAEAYRLEALEIYNDIRKSLESL